MTAAAVEFVSSPAPWWVTAVLVALAFIAGLLWSRSAATAARHRAQAAEREAQWATDRAEAAQQAAGAVTRALPAWPDPVCETLTTRGGSPDDLDRQAFQADAAALRDDLRTAAADFPALSPDARAEARRDGAVRYGAGLTGQLTGPRHDWSATGWSPDSPTTVLDRPVPGVLPRGYGWLARLLVAAVAWCRRVLAYPGQRWAAARFEPADESPWAEGELAEETAVLPAVGRAVVRRELPRSYHPVHVWGRGLRMVSAAAVLGGVARTGQTGRHREGEALGALGQRRIRMFALPAGAR